MATPEIIQPPDENRPPGAPDAGWRHGRDIVAIIYGESGTAKLLILSQVILSLERIAILNVWLLYQTFRGWLA